MLFADSSENSDEGENAEVIPASKDISAINVTPNNSDCVRNVSVVIWNSTVYVLIVTIVIAIIVTLYGFF